MLSRRWAMAPGLAVEHFEVEIRDLWYLFCLSARYIDANCPAQDRLVRIVGVAGGWGVLRRRREGGDGEGVEEARTAEGRIWTDLPFLAGDLRDMWRECMMGGYEGEDEEERQRQRVNLTAAIARLVIVGICAVELGQCGLEVMRLALEMEEEEGQRARMMSLVRVWLRYAGHQLLLRCLAGAAADGGWRVGGDGDGTGADECFSRDRFVTWKSKLEELRGTTEHDDAEEVKCANLMGYIRDSYHGPR
ncbi:hypothetical protein GE09DRAFT_1210159 [Coniochaeta sp. 2T2.1]|nr:hypothetical protein GE09DRAFT_1210159 [Coniochaeta sp. 2T2.1]